MAKIQTQIILIGDERADHWTTTSRYLQPDVQNNR